MYPANKARYNMTNPFDAIDARLSNIESLLLDLKHSPALNNPEKESDRDELLTVPAAARFLSLSVPTVYSLISRGELPVMKRSKRCYFSKLELISYLRAGRRKTLKETEAEAETYLKKKGGKA